MSPTPDLIDAFSRVHVLISNMDGDPHRWLSDDLRFIAEIKRRLRDEPLFAEDLRRTMQDFSILFARAVASS